MEIYFFLAIIIPATTFIYMFLLWKKHGKDKIPKNITIQKEPPNKITPAMAGYIYNNGFKYNRYIVSTIIEMAVMGFIKLEVSGRNNKIINFSIKDNKFKENRIYEVVINFLNVFFDPTVIKNTSKENSIKESVVLHRIKRTVKSIMLLLVIFIFSLLFTIISTGYYKEPLSFNINFWEIIFGMVVLGVVGFIFSAVFVFIIPFCIIKIIRRGKVFKKESWTKSISYDFDRKFPEMKKGKLVFLSLRLKEIKKEIIKDIKNFYFNENFKEIGIYPFLKNYSKIAIVAFVCLMIVFFKAVHRNSIPPFISANSELALAIVLVLFFPAFIIYAFDFFMAKRNTYGTEIYRQLLGFKKYLSLKEKIDSQEANQKIFEKYFPYAVALGVGEEWANRFKEVKFSMPEWFLIKNQNSGLEKYSNYNSTEITNKISSAINSVVAIKQSLPLTIDQDNIK